jgi:hypothetical protein
MTCSPATVLFHSINSNLDYWNQRPRRATLKAALPSTGDRMLWVTTSVIVADQLCFP